MPDNVFDELGCSLIVLKEKESNRKIALIADSERRNRGISAFITGRQE